MQATGTLREARFSKGFILVVVAMLCALLLGAAGGYLARGGSQATGGGSVHAQAANDANQGGPDSDLTRVLPTAGPNPAAGYDISQWSDSNAAQPIEPDYGYLP
jgi:hypothetical protein